MASDVELIYDWIVKGGTPSAEPKVNWITMDNNSGESSKYVYDKFPWKTGGKFTRKDDSSEPYTVVDAEVYIRSLFTALEEDKDLDTAKYDDLPDDFPNFVRNLATVLKRENGTPLEITMNSTGNEIATLTGVNGDTQKKIIGHPAVTFDDYWNAASDKLKAAVIYNYFIEVFVNSNSKAFEGYKKFKKSGSDYNTLELKNVKDNYYFDGGITSGFRSNKGQDNFTLTRRFAFRINEVFFASTPSLFMQDENNVQKFIEAEAGGTSATQATKNKEIQDLRNENLKKAGIFADFQKKEEELTAQEKEERDAFFKEVEQCILLSKVDKLAQHRKRERKNTITNFNNATAGSHLPYGGRIIPVDVNDDNPFLNYCNDVGTLYEYSTLLSNNINGKISYKFLISKINNVEVEGNPTDVEMPILFGSQTNIFHNKNVGEFEKVNSPDGSSVVDAAEAQKIIKIPTNRAVTSITYESLSIKFHGENQATAKTNVDVDISLKLPNLNLLQAEFQSTTGYVDSLGVTKDYPYTYSVLDLITYLHRDDLSDYWKKLTQNGARFFQPKFLKTRNRLILKILPTIADSNDLDSNERANYDIIKQHIESHPFILDLALVDHTINKESDNDSATITISYKGYIRSFMQDQKLDIIRTYDEILTAITNEETFIDELTRVMDDDKAISDIDTHNAARKTQSRTLVDRNKSNILGNLQSAGRLYTVKVDARKALDNNVTKKLEFLDTGRVRDSIKEGTIASTTLAPGLTPDDLKSHKDANSTTKLHFFYLGDIIDAAMGNLYYYNRPARIGGSTGVTRLCQIDTLRAKFDDFPLYVILPSFYPLELVNNKDGSSTWKNSNVKVSLADFPISLSWFTQWYTKEFLDSEVEFYTLGTFINKLIGTVINTYLTDQCYLNGSHKRIQYAVKSDFGLWSYDKSFAGNNTAQRNKGLTWLHLTMLDPNSNGYPYLTHTGTAGTWRKDLTPGSYKVSSFAKLYKEYAAFMKKNLRIPRSEYANFIIVYPQTSVFSNYEGLEYTVESLTKSNVPLLQRGTGIEVGELVKQGQLVKTIKFEKSEANYQREARYEADNLYTLAQIASVYNATVDSEPILNLFPGMIVFVNAGLYYNSNTRGSIANILGMGGFHLVESVTHKANISDNDLNSFTTSTKAIWLSAGSVKTFNSTPGNNHPTPKKQPKPPQNPAQQSAPPNGTPAQPNSTTPKKEDQKDVRIPAEIDDLNRKYGGKPSTSQTGEEKHTVELPADDVNSYREEGGRYFWVIWVHQDNIKEVRFQKNTETNTRKLNLKKFGDENLYVLTATEKEISNAVTLKGTLIITRK